jgi:hypothetical protein
MTDQVRYIGDLAPGRQWWRCLACWQTFEMSQPKDAFWWEWYSNAEAAHDCAFVVTMTGVARRRPAGDADAR